MSVARRCLGCSATYPLNAHACPKCGSHAAEVETKDSEKSASAAYTEPKPKPKPSSRRKS